MVEKLNHLIKENVKKEIFIISGIAENSFESAIHEASGVIIDVLKSQLDKGKAKDIMSFFKGKISDRNSLTKMMVNKYSNRLNRYYSIDPASAKDLSLSVIPSTIEKFVVNANTEDKKSENGMFAFLNWLSGNTINFEGFFLRMNNLQIA